MKTLREFATEIYNFEMKTWFFVSALALILFFMGMNYNPATVVTYDAYPHAVIICGDENNGSMVINGDHFEDREVRLLITRAKIECP